MFYVNGLNLSYTSLTQGNRVLLTTTASSILWEIIKYPVSVNESSYTPEFGVSRALTSTTLSESLVINVPGTFKLKVTEDGGTPQFFYIEVASPITGITPPFPGETTESDVTDGWSRKVEKSLQSLERESGNISFWGIESGSSHGLGALVGIYDVSSISSPKGLFELRSATSGDWNTSLRQLGIVVDRYETYSGSGEYYYKVLMKGSEICPPTFAVSVDADNNFYFNISTLTLSTTSTDPLIGKFFSGNRVLILDAPISTAPVSSGSTTNSGVKVTQLPEGTIDPVLGITLSLGTIPEDTVVEKIVIQVFTPCSQVYDITIGSVADPELLVASTTVDLTASDNLIFEVSESISSDTEIFIITDALTGVPSGLVNIFVYYSQIFA